MPRFLRAVIRAPGLRDKRAAPGVFFAAMLLLSLPAAAGAQSQDSRGQGHSGRRLGMAGAEEG